MGSTSLIEPLTATRNQRVTTAARAFCRFSILFVLILAATGNITNNVLLRYGFMDNNEPRHGFVSMMEGIADKPFVYRSLSARGVLAAARWIVGHVPANRIAHLETKLALREHYFTTLPAAQWTPIHQVSYTLMYTIVCATTALMLAFVYWLARLRGLSYAEALAFLAAFSFLYPFTFQAGAFYYDFPEICGVFGACYFFLRRWMFTATLWIVLFAFNKETFFLVPVALFFLHESGVPLRRRLQWLVVQFAGCFAARLFLMHGYERNGGNFIEFHLWNNLKFWLNPRTYFSFHGRAGLGIALPSMENLLVLVPLVLYFGHAWKRAEPRVRHYLLAAVIPLLMLYIPFAYDDEFRDLALAFPAVVLLALSVAQEFGSIFGSRRSGSSPNYDAAAVS